ncbi:three-Cys-motif partner protein TcmP [Halorubellus sp. PRR65]|uniref:three-Cys-motif partner protein TcmP n=1 Tax=Halorubellus sp. PRR65 TaxID=3098148 RepID=UPI002B259B3B|nr:three-Cys-motif partner protein TcmP [Halorubellus sp. PRR65]
MDGPTYLKRRIDAVRQRSDEVLAVAPGVANEFDSWSVLKLILHSAAVRMYTDVHQGQETGKTFYIDALAGSGVSKYSDSECFLGSPLVACKAAQEPFTKMYFIEANGDYARALKDRLEHAFSLPKFTKPDEYEIIDRDANDALGDIAREIQSLGDYDERFNYYCFIDNQAMDVNWNAISDITPTPYGDLLINIPITHAIGRSANQNTMEALSAFYGIDMHGHATGDVTREDLLQLYLDRIKNQGREVIESTRVQTDVGSFWFDLAYATRKTGGSNGYMRVIRYVREFIESVHSGHVDTILDDGQTGLTDFTPDTDIADALPDDEPQRELTEF